LKLNIKAQKISKSTSNLLLIFIIFLIAALSTRVVIMTYYPQYTYFADIFSSLLIATGTAFSIPFIIMKYLSFPPKYSSEKAKKWILNGLIILIFVTAFLESYFENIPNV
jgi:uncharacterized membrane protein